MQGQQRLRTLGETEPKLYEYQTQAALANSNAAFGPKSLNALFLL